MKRIKTHIAFFAALPLIALLYVSADAQRNRDRFTRRDVGQIVADLEQSSNIFRRDFDLFLDQTSINGTREEDRLNNIVVNYERSLNRLRRDFDRTDSWWESRTNVQDVLNNARPVNNMMVSLPFARQLERQWRDMRRDINRLADTFELPNLSGGGGGGGGNWDGGFAGGNMSRPPDWARGTFYSTDGSGITLTIGPEGRVTVINAGQPYYGTFYRNTINVNYDTSDIQRTRDGVRTFNRTTRQTTHYSRTNSGPSGPWNGGYGNATRPPDWAQGTFYSTNGPSITMSIGGDGRITLYTDGQTYNGVYANGMIDLNGDVSTVTQTRNGFRTYNQRTGQTTNYRRR